jgi:hypothetical protein
MGYGAALGWLSAAAVAVHVRASPLRVAAADVGFVVGGLLGAGLGSPLLLGDASAGRQRAWAGVTAASALGGGVTAALLFRPRGAGSLKRTAGIPLFGVIGEGPTGAPILGLGYMGSIEALMEHFPR